MYAKLVPQDKNKNLDELQEAEGVLSKDNTNEKKIREILHYGRLQKRMNHFGIHLGEKEDLDGILNALL
jgi:hypothetical protein